LAKAAIAASRVGRRGRVNLSRGVRTRHPEHSSNANPQIPRDAANAVAVGASAPDGLGLARIRILYPPAAKPRSLFASAGKPGHDAFGVDVVHQVDNRPEFR
jgi:hypothetical protein